MSITGSSSGDDAAATANMLASENSGFSIDAGVRIALIDRDVPSYFWSLEHLLKIEFGRPLRSSDCP